jgi:hypothetical protein
MDCRNGSLFTEPAGSPSLIIDRSDSIAARATSQHDALSTRLWLPQHMMELCWESENSPRRTNYSSEYSTILQRPAPRERIRFLPYEASYLWKELFLL